MFHDAELPGSIHVPYNWSYATEADRLAAVAADFITADEGKFARQLDDDSIWMLTDATGPTWVAVSANAVPSNFVTPPATSSSPGVAGQYSGDAFYFYDCYATNSWGRTPRETGY